MFDLEKSISRWREQLSASGLGMQKVLDELESHLREAMERQIRAGENAEKAFDLAVREIGEGRALNAEFLNARGTRMKGNASRADSRLKVPLLAVSGVLLIMALFLPRTVTGGGKSPLLLLHVVAATIGYCAVLAAGSFGMYFVVVRWFVRSAPEHERMLSGATVSCYCVSAASVGIALLSGMIWSGANLGESWTRSPREWGALMVLAWAAAAIVFQRFWSGRSHGATLICIGGNVIVGLAWFGAGILTSGAQGLANHYPFEIFLGLQVLFVTAEVFRSRRLYLNLI